MPCNQSGRLYRHRRLILDILFNAQSTAKVISPESGRKHKPSANHNLPTVGQNLCLCHVSLCLKKIGKNEVEWTRKAEITKADWTPGRAMKQALLYFDLLVAGRWSTHCCTLTYSWQDCEARIPVLWPTPSRTVKHALLYFDLLLAGLWSMHCCTLTYLWQDGEAHIAELWPTPCFKTESIW